VGEATSNVRWSFLGLGVKVAVQAVAAFLVARIVGTHSYGTMSLGLIYVTLTNLLLDQGMGQALVRADDLPRSDVATAQVASGALAIVAMLITWAIAAPISHFYSSEPGLGPVLIGLSFGLIFKAVVVPGRAVLQRNFSFRWLAGCEIISSVLGVAASLVTAEFNGQAMSLVSQMLVTDGVYAIGVIKLSGLPIRGANFAALRGMLGMTSQIAGSQWLGFVSRNADNALIGKVLGTGPLALYAVSYRLMMLPITNLTQVANRVLLPTYARLQDDVATFRRAFLKSTRLMSLTSTPAMALLIAFASPLIVGAMGHKWQGAVFPTQVLAVVAIIQSQTSLVTPAIIAFGRSKWQLYWSAISTVLVVGVFLVTVHRGLNAVCLGYGLFNVLTLWVPIGLVGRFGGFTQRDFLVSVGPGLGLGAIFLVIGSVITFGLDQAGAPLLVNALGGGATAVLLGLVAIRVVMPKSLLELWALTARGKAKRPADPAIPVAAGAN
jgi:O-antigen/teichoic acid export membrane protein